MKSTCGRTRLDLKIEKDQKLLFENQTSCKFFFQNLTRFIFLNLKSDAFCFVFQNLTSNKIFNSK